MATKAVHFTKSCLKTLTAVEAEHNRSNQHEFQGVSPLKNIFGIDRCSLTAIFSIRGSDDFHKVDLTWYDARENNPDRTPEFRLYFKSNPIMNSARENDSIIIGVDKNNLIHCELIKSTSSEYIYSSNWKGIQV